MLSARNDVRLFGLSIATLIGVNSMSDTDSMLAFGLFERDRTGHAAGHMGSSFPADGWERPRLTRGQMAGFLLKPSGLQFPD